MKLLFNIKNLSLKKFAMKNNFKHFSQNKNFDAKNNFNTIDAEKYTKMVNEIKNISINELSRDTIYQEKMAIDVILNNGHKFDKITNDMIKSQIKENIQKNVVKAVFKKKFINISNDDEKLMYENFILKIHKEFESVGSSIKFINNIIKPVIFCLYVVSGSCISIIAVGGYHVLSYWFP